MGEKVGGLVDFGVPVRVWMGHDERYEGRVVTGALRMREGSWRLVAGFALAFGTVWILLAAFVVGCLVRWSSGAQHLTESLAMAGSIGGIVVWVCGGSLAVSFAAAVMRRRHVLALGVLILPLIGMWAACRGPVVASDSGGPVLAVGYAIGLACVCVSVTAALGWVLRPQPSPPRTRSRASRSHWKLPIPV